MNHGYNFHLPLSKPQLMLRSGSMDCHENTSEGKINEEDNNADALSKKKQHYDLGGK